MLLLKKYYAFNRMLMGVFIFLSVKQSVFAGCAQELQDDYGDIATHQSGEDSQLMSEVQVGNEDAFAKLYYKHFERLATYIRNKFETVDAELCASTALTQVWVNRMSFRPESNFQSWLYTIATHEALSVLRKKQTRKEVDGALPRDWNDSRVDAVERVIDPDSQPDPALAIDQNDLNVENANLSPIVIAQLNPSQVLLYRRLKEGVPIEEIAIELGISTATVKDRITTIRKKLKRIIANPSSARSVTEHTAVVARKDKKFWSISDEEILKNLTPHEQAVYRLWGAPLKEIMQKLNLKQGTLSSTMHKVREKIRKMELAAAQTTQVVVKEDKHSIAHAYSDYFVKPLEPITPVVFRDDSHPEFMAALKALSEIAPDQALIYSERVLDGKKIKQIAKEQHSDVKSVKAKLGLARGTMKRKLGVEAYEKLDSLAPQFKKYRDKFLVAQSQLQTKKLMAAWMQLSDPYRLPYWYYFIEDKTYSQIAEMMKTDEPTARRHVYLARAQLADKLGEDLDGLFWLDPKTKAAFLEMEKPSGNLTKKAMHSLARLSDLKREVFYFYVIQGKSITELANLLKITEFEARTQLSEAIESLKKDLKEDYGRVFE